MNKNQEMVAEKMKKQLSLAVRSIQWSYAIFWSSSAAQPEVLSWGGGYYNGDIKTRKTNQAVELNSDKIGLQRSEQLRELFKSLKTTDSSPQTKRLSASLSPEDLTDTEWYYLVCMSFVFNIGQGLPGRSLANGQPIWLCNAHSADCGVFSRCLLAKSASVQTVVCFPFMDGVIELGTTDLVSEDLSLIQRIRTSFLNTLDANAADKSGAELNTRNGGGNNGHNVKPTPEVGYGVIINTRSPNSSSNVNHPPDGTLMVERINGGTSQVMDDELSNCIHNSMNSSDCVSQSLASPEMMASLSKGENATKHPARDLQNCNNSKMTLVDPQSDDWHYQMVLSTVLKSSDQLIKGVYFQNFHQESSFVRWNKNEGPMNFQSPVTGTAQNLLKKVLFEVPRMHLDGLLESQEENDFKEGMRQEADENGMNHVLSERKRRAKLNERFLTLRSMVPSITKDDKVSILDDAIEYLRKLEKRVRDLEAHKEELVDIESRSKRSPQDMMERTSDNYFNKNDNCKKSVAKKRKNCETDETRSEINNVTVSIGENEVVIEMKGPSRQGKFLKIMEVANSLNLDLNSVQSTEADGNLYLTIKSKFKGPTNNVSAKRIKQALQNAASRC